MKDIQVPESQIIDLVPKKRIVISFPEPVIGKVINEGAMPDEVLKVEKKLGTIWETK